MIAINPIPIGTITASQFADEMCIELNLVQLMLDQLVTNGDITPPVIHTLFVGPIFPFDVAVYLENELTGQIVNNGPPLVKSTNLISVQAAKSGNLTDGLFEWSFGDGVASSTGGYAIPYDCELVSLSCSVETAPVGQDAEIAVTVNGVNVSTVIIPVGSNTSNNVLINPIKITESDLLNFKTIVAFSSADGVINTILKINI